MHSGKKMQRRQRQDPIMTETFYSQWQTVRRVQCVEETGSGPPPERVLQALWQRQYLDRQTLCTLEERPVRVLHPGFWNHEAGPDFQSAVIRFGEEPPISGPVEIDLRSADWRAHGHASNPAFAGVILHVVWEGPAKTPLPTLALQPHLAAGWEKVTPMQTLPTEFAGRCHAPLVSMPETDKNELLKQAAMARLQAKAHSLVQMARENGWEAALMQGLFRALGTNTIFGRCNTWPINGLLCKSFRPRTPRVGRHDCWEWRVG